MILYSQKDFAEEVKRITEGKGVNAVYDGVGKTTFVKGICCMDVITITVQNKLSVKYS